MTDDNVAVLLQQLEQFQNDDALIEAFVKVYMPDRVMSVDESERLGKAVQGIVKLVCLAGTPTGPRQNSASWPTR